MEKHPAIDAILIDDQKDILRKHMLELTQLTHWQESTEAVVKNLQEHLLTYPSETIIGAYWPIKGEINILQLLDNWHTSQRKLCLPVIEALDSPLTFYPWCPHSTMEKGHHQIPIPSERQKNILPDVLLIPLLAFDLNGYRLGRGGGYYDRTLAKLRKQKNIKSIGLAVDQQLVPNVPHHFHDERLDCVITDTQIYFFE